MDKLKRILSNKILLTATILISTVLIFILVGLFINGSEDDIQGNVDFTDYRVSSKVASRVVDIRVKEGQRVHKGDTLVILSAPEINAKENQAEAAYSMATDIAEKADNGNRSEEIQKACENWNQTIAIRDIAAKTYERFDKLFNEGVISEQKRDEIKAKYNAASAAEKAAHSQYTLMINGTRAEEKATSHAMVRKAEATVEEIESYRKETVMTAVADGYVTEIFPEIGELLGTGAPIMNVNTDDAWFSFYMREDLLPGIVRGEILNIYIPALNKHVKAKVSLIKNVGDFAAWKATKKLDKYDLKIFEVQAHPCKPISNLQAGMSAIMKK